MTLIRSYLLSGDSDIEFLRNEATLSEFRSFHPAASRNFLLHHPHLKNTSFVVALRADI